ncbi:hypothetical protein GHV40_00870 [Devosia sp. D6-9]|nr:hypothetical protein GHV40_00870 [Devosia sp. D6-9]
MGIAWVRKYYGVPAKRGGRVEYTGEGHSEFGTIAGARGAHLSIRLDGWKFALPFHPTWKLRYLTPAEAMQSAGGAN